MFFVVVLCVCVCGVFECVFFYRKFTSATMQKEPIRFLALKSGLCPVIVDDNATVELDRSCDR